MTPCSNECSNSGIFIVSLPFCVLLWLLLQAVALYANHAIADPAIGNVVAYAAVGLRSVFTFVVGPLLVLADLLTTRRIR